MIHARVTVLIGGDREIEVPLIAPSGAEIRVIGHVATGDDAVATVLAELPDVLLLDTRITGSGARAVCRDLREWAPFTKVLAAAQDDDEGTYTTVVAGAAGAVLAASDKAAMAAAVRGVGNGGSVLLPRCAQRLLHDLDAWAQRSADPLHPPPTLTATEREVLEQIAAGNDTKQVAAAHEVTPHLVNLHVGYAVSKLHRYVLGAHKIAADE